MKTQLLTLALGLSFFTLGFAADADRSSQNSRASLLQITKGSSVATLADKSTQNSKISLVAANAGSAKEIGKVTVVQAEKGAAYHVATVALTR